MDLVRSEQTTNAPTRRGSFDAHEKHFPSPLAGEGQGEGDKTRERSERIHSKLKTTQLPSQTESSAERSG